VERGRFVTGWFALFLVTVVVAVAAGWVGRARPIVLDSERLFKVALATGLRVRVEGAGGGAEDWASAVVRFVPYHPAGRDPARKVMTPGAETWSGPALPGERALLEALAKRPDVPGRWQRMFDEDEVALAARLDDPADLGPTWDPAAWLGPGLSWDGVGAWVAGGDGPVGEAVSRRIGAARWVIVDGAPGLPELGRALGSELGARVAAVVPFDDDFDTMRLAVAKALADAAPTVADRLFLVASGLAVQPLLAALADAPDARDRLSAVLLLHPAMAGDPGRDGPFGEVACRDRVAGAWRHATLDVERMVARPWFAMQWLDRSTSPPSAGGLPLVTASLPVPSDEGGLEASVLRLELGPLAADPEAPLELVARALWLVLSVWAVR
jgi:hypothetical protein